MKSVYPHPSQTQHDSLQGGFSEAVAGVSTEALSRLPFFPRELLDNCLIAGKSVHKWISCVALHLLSQFNERSTFALIKAKTADSGRPLEKLELEIVSQIRNAFPHRRQRKYLHAFVPYRARSIRRTREVVR